MALVHQKMVPYEKLVVFFDIEDFLLVVRLGRFHLYLLVIFLHGVS
jgi:hypothetical protein